MKRKMVLVGAITAAHGIRGEVKLRSFTADPAAIASYSPLETAAGGKIEIAKLRTRKDGFIASLKGVTDRNAAEALRGTELFVPRGCLPEPGDGVYVHDLTGLPVHLADGSLLGEIAGVADYGAGDLIDVKIEGRKDTVLIPFAPQYVLEAAEDRIVVDLPKGYLDVEEER
ncbi:ribosome maturation factor RimM [Aestuariivirga sp.]|uniref:ribosome maturation factor RimM n=1 Tax=Aestuariivirga sp. TaxID=2650926 RepID=UPI0025BA1226|nr:ribosome maturation factor RimM [Aestuariivirga sp.]MCA3555654.1 16S rRNA processing protein RimM [Aestuariivirga sp.]